MAKQNKLSKEDLERYQRYQAERAEAAAELQKAQQRFAAVEAKYQGQVVVIEAEYDFDPIADEIADDGTIQKGAASEQVQASRRSLRERRLRMSGHVAGRQV